MLISLQFLRFERRDGPMANVVVQLVDRAADDPLAFLPRRALSQHCLARAAYKQWSEKRFVRPMKQKVAMKLSIGRQRLIEHQFQHGRRLVRITKCRRLLTFFRELRR